VRVGELVRSLTVRCRKCQGKKVTKEKKRVEFLIQPGTESGERIALKGEGDAAVSCQGCYESLTNCSARYPSGRCHLPHPTPTSFDLQAALIIAVGLGCQCKDRSIRSTARLLARHVCPPRRKGYPYHVKTRRAYHRHRQGACYPG